jgi:hypothetical protein
MLIAVRYSSLYYIVHAPRLAIILATFEHSSGAQLLEDVADSSHEMSVLAGRYHARGGQLLDTIPNGYL